MAGAQRARDQVDRLGKLLLELEHALRARALDEPAYGMHAAKHAGAERRAASRRVKNTDQQVQRRAPAQADISRNVADVDAHAGLLDAAALQRADERAIVSSADRSGPTLLSCLLGLEHAPQTSVLRSRFVGLQPLEQLALRRGRRAAQYAPTMMRDDADEDCERNPHGRSCLLHRPARARTSRAGSWMPTRASCSLAFGRMPVARKRP